MQSSDKLRTILIAATTALVVLAGVCGGCSSTGTPKTCTTDEVKKCDDQLTQCTSVAPCTDGTDPGFQGCVDACKKKNCDCQSACGNTCR